MTNRFFLTNNIAEEETIFKSDMVLKKKNHENQFSSLANYVVIVNLFEKHRYRETAIYMYI